MFAWWSWRRYAAFMLALVPILFVEKKLVTLMHELAHFAGAAIFGAPPRRLVLSILGGGSAHSDWTAAGGGSALGHSVCTGAGVVLTGLVGVLILVFAARAGRPLALLLLSLFGSLAVLGSLTYVTLGLEHDFGDPGAILGYLGIVAQPPRCTDRGLALPFLAISPLIAWYSLRAYARAQQLYLPAPRLWQRLLVAAVTLGPLATPVAVAAAWRLASVDETLSRHCHLRAATTLLHRISPPPRPLAHLLTLPLLLAGLAAGGTLALWRVHEAGAPTSPSRRQILLAWGAVALVVGLLALLGQPLFTSALTD